MSRRARLATLVAVLFLASSPADAQAQGPAIPHVEPAHCPVEAAPDERIDCGALIVPERRGTLGSRTIRLPVMIFRSRAPASSIRTRRRNGAARSSTACRPRSTSRCAAAATARPSTPAGLRIVAAFLRAPASPPPVGARWPCAARTSARARANADGEVPPVKPRNARPSPTAASAPSRPPSAGAARCRTRSAAAWRPSRPCGRRTPRSRLAAP